MNFISWIGKLHCYSMNMSNKFKTLGNFFGGIIAVVTAVSYIKKTESFIMDSVHQISDSINEAEVYTAGACVALTIGGYTSGFTLGVIGYSLGTMNFLLHPLWKKCLKLEDITVNQENNNFNIKECLFTIRKFSWWNFSFDFNDKNY